MGKLQVMLEKQAALQERVGYDFDSMTTEERVMFIKEMSIHMTQELHEMLYELPFFKPWKDYSHIELDEVADCMISARKEFIDMLHFFMNIAIALGYTHEDGLCADYLHKNKENHKRQDEGYTHDKSFRGQ